MQELMRIHSNSSWHYKVLLVHQTFNGDEVNWPVRPLGGAPWFKLMITFHWHTYTYTLTHMTLSTIRIFFFIFSPVLHCSLSNQDLQSFDGMMCCFKLLLCRWIFFIYGYLLVFIYICIGMTPFVCEECGKSFTQNTNLSRHKKVHLSGKFNCSQCSTKFSSERSLEKHNQNDHGKILVSSQTYVVLCVCARWSWNWIMVHCLMVALRKNAHLRQIFDGHRPAL